MGELLKLCQINLKILGKVQPSDKIYTEGKIITISKISSLQGLSRFMFKESRNKTVETIKSIIQYACDLSNLIQNQKMLHDISENKESTYLENVEFENQCKILWDLTNDLDDSKKGIVNLKSNYQDDNWVVSEFELILKTVDQEISLIRNNVKKLVQDFNKVHQNDPIKSFGFQKIK